MRNGSRNIIWTWVVSALVVMVLLAGGSSASLYHPYISRPGNIPNFDSYRTPTIEPGDRGTLRFNVTNRYELPMTNVTLEIGIYRWATIEDSKPVERVRNAPEISGCSYPSWEKLDAHTIVIRMGTLTPNLNTTLEITIRTRDDTPEGTYFVRAMIRFDYDNMSGIEMRSRGYYTQSEWDAATRRSEENPAGLNLSALGVSGIVPDTSFSVRSPMPIWPLAILIALIVIFGGLALLFYLMDEQGYFPELKKRIDGRGRRPGR